MNSRWMGYRRAFICIIVFLSLFAVASACSQSFSSNGQRIYFTASSSSGQPITHTGGPGMMPGRLACVNCHGEQGHGGRVTIMMQTLNVPDITWPVLTADDPPYTEDTLKRAITQGIDPAGDSLDYVMPRWQMIDSDLNDLVSYIKTLP